VSSQQQQQHWQQQGSSSGSSKGTEVSHTAANPVILACLLSLSQTLASTLSLLMLVLGIQIQHC
jgi:hypothetical protein